MPLISGVFGVWKGKLSPRTVFMFSIRSAKVHCVKGSPSLNFQRDCEDVVKEMCLTKGTISGVKNKDGKIQIKCSGSIPKAAAQRLRNIWGFYTV